MIIIQNVYIIEFVAISVKDNLLLIIGIIDNCVTIYL